MLYSFKAQHHSRSSVPNTATPSSKVCPLSISLFREKPEEKLKSMECLSYFLTFLLLVGVLNVAKGQPLVLALFIFGDSVVDAGNNNNLYTIIKANFPPCGRDFNDHKPTGRFCNGKLASDYRAESLGFTSYQPAYLNLKAKGSNLLNGANFASAASGYYDLIAKVYVMMMTRLVSSID